MEKLNSVKEIKEYLNRGKGACKQLADEYGRKEDNMSRRMSISFMVKYNTYEEILARIEGRPETILALS